MLKRRRKEWMWERKEPGDREPDECSPGSIEQELDMCERGSLRGDEILHHHGRVTEEPVDEDPRELDQWMSEERYAMNMSEEDREGDEMSGDEHSSGLQGGESELERQTHIDSGLPGNQRQRWEEIERSDFINQEEGGIQRADVKIPSPRRLKGR